VTRMTTVSIRTALLCGGSIGSLLLAPPPAIAQTHAAAGVSQLQEVVVTARKREERLIDVPVAASALSAEGVERYNSTDLATVAANVPGVTLSRAGGGGNGAAFSIRGVGNLAADYGNEQPVAINIDGVQITRGRIATVGLFDVQRVEVLKGPQALFFGKNSPAGVVSVTSQAPGKEFGGFVRGSYEFRTRTPQLEGAVSIPITDALAIRLAGRWSNMYGGYIYNDARPVADPFDVNPLTGLRDLTLPGADHRKGPGTEQKVARFTAAYQPTDDFNATFKLMGSRERDNGGSVYAEVVQCGRPPNPIALGVPDTQANCIADRHKSNGASPPTITQNFLYSYGGKAFNQTDNIVSSLQLNYRLNSISLTSVTGFYYSLNKAYDNYEGTVYAQATDGQRDEHRQYSQEFRAVSDFDGPLNFSVGGLYQYELRDWLNTDKIAPLGPITAAQAPLVVAPGLDFTQYVGKYNSALFTARNLVTVYSLFGQARWQITPELEFAAGARWTEEHKKTDIGSVLNRIPSFSPAGYRYHPAVQNSNVSPEVTLTWKPQADLTTYVAYKTGFLSSGIQNPGNVVNYHGICQTRQPANVTGCENDLLTYDPQKVKGFEGGIKGYLLDRRLLLDLSVYRYKFTNLQVTTFDPTTLSFLIQNAGGSRSQGGELQLQYNATEELQLRATVAYTDLKYTEYSSGPCPQGSPILPTAPISQRQEYLCYAIAGATSGQQFLSGTRYGSAPLQTDLGAIYRRTLTNGWGVDATVDWYFYSRGPRRIRYALGGEAHSLFNASIRASSPDKLWEVALIGTNLANDIWFPVPPTEKPFGVFTATSGDLQSVLQPPRQVTVQLTRRF
jgi:iron complex outermembrane receptor protein